MDIRKIKKLIELINETGVGEIEVKSSDGDSVRISRHSGTPVTVPVTTTAAAPPTVAAATNTPPTEHTATPASAHHGHEVTSPMVGTVYLAPTPGAKPFVEVGQRIQAGDTICLIEAMKMFNKIEADASGVVSARLVDNDQPVEYDQALFIIDTDE